MHFFRNSFQVLSKLKFSTNYVEHSLSFIKNNAISQKGFSEFDVTFDWKKRKKNWNQNERTPVYVSSHMHMHMCRYCVYQLTKSCRSDFILHANKMSYSLLYDMNRCYWNYISLIDLICIINTAIASNFFFCCAKSNARFHTILVYFLLFFFCGWRQKHTKVKEMCIDRFLWGLLLLLVLFKLKKKNARQCRECNGKLIFNEFYEIQTSPSKCNKITLKAKQKQIFTFF